MVGVRVMAVHVQRGLGVAIYRFWPIPILTPARLDRSHGRIARRLNILGLTRSRAVLVEDLTSTRTDGA